MIAGKLKITIKINELPQPKTVENAWQKFDLDCDGRIRTITVKPKIYKKLTDAASNYLQWMPAMSNDKQRSVYTGKLGQSTEHGFVLEEPSIQVFERKPKAETTSAVGAAS
ncbi:fertility inhibition FinO-like protein [Nostoc sp. 'Peltigera membranacea cyanobiont' 232]|uniref:fertility inhibition FinO-like protein n=1 Tax=Nostoc sp. 'Peltigera membranacea cyanobiont' 232 TaxID=2014531 RepID=UPI000B95313E|nr:fertility inhibition FinO-like protein [Nostoc sp. 'Peltigera membranacea cyanobiont' 232]OYE00225.1 fertility inhibition FinO-like protein [Nostoc sp. 'Peltigera membranacea cyanobiont' 232]